MMKNVSLEVLVAETNFCIYVQILQFPEVLALVEADGPSEWNVDPPSAPPAQNEEVEQGELPEPWVWP